MLPLLDTQVRITQQDYMLDFPVPWLF